jgi:hypothetical protein
MAPHTSTPTHAPAVLQLVTFGLDGLDDTAYRAHCAEVAPAFADIPGLQRKVWLADARQGVYGGLYAWQDRHALEAHLGGPLYDALRTNPHLTGLRSQTLEVLRGPTELTG